MKMRPFAGPGEGGGLGKGGFGFGPGRGGGVGPSCKPGIALRMRSRTLFNFPCSTGCKRFPVALPYSQVTFSCTQVPSADAVRKTEKSFGLETHFMIPPSCARMVVGDWPFIFHFRSSSARRQISCARSRGTGRISSSVRVRSSIGFLPGRLTQPAVPGQGFILGARATGPLCLTNSPTTGLSLLRRGRKAVMPP